jgi:hypothetical protein
MTGQDNDKPPKTIRELLLEEIATNPPVQEGTENRPGFRDRRGEALISAEGVPA